MIKVIFDKQLNQFVATVGCYKYLYSFGKTSDQAIKELLHILIEEGLYTLNQMLFDEVYQYTKQVLIDTYNFELRDTQGQDYMFWFDPIIDRVTPLSRKDIISIYRNLTRKDEL
jgi:hypothetical protein